MTVDHRETPDHVTARKVARQLSPPIDYLARIACETGLYRLSLILLEARTEVQAIGWGNLKSVPPSASPPVPPDPK